MASPTTLQIGWPCHIKCTPQVHPGPVQRSPKCCRPPVAMGHAPFNARGGAHGVLLSAPENENTENGECTDGTCQGTNGTKGEPRWFVRPSISRTRGCLVGQCLAMCMGKPSHSPRPQGCYPGAK